VSWVRKVDSQGRIEFNGAEYFVRRKLERQYVVATLSTHHRLVFIKHEGQLIKSVPFPFTGMLSSPSDEGQTVHDVLTVPSIKNRYTMSLRLPHSR